MQRSNRHKHGGIVDRRGDNAAHGALDVSMVVNVGVVERDLAPSTKTRRRVGFALDEHIDDSPIEILRLCPVRQVEPRGPNRPVHALLVKGVVHHVVANAIAASRSWDVADHHRLRLVEFDTRRARRH